MAESITAQTLTVVDTSLLDASNNLLNPSQSYLPVVKPEDKYPSQIFTSENDINNLIASAAALFCLIPKFRRADYDDNIDELYNYLCHEIRAFESSAQSNDFYSESIILARYSLCALIDETILSTTWGQEGNWQEHSLLMTFHGENSANERYFQILEKLMCDPTHHIDLLEFYYTCISLGFMGKYRLQDNGRSALDDEMDQLYKAIRTQRGDFEKALTPVLQQRYEQTQTVAPRAAFPSWLLYVLTGTLVITMYSGFRYILGTSVSPLYQSVLEIKHETAQPSATHMAANQYTNYR